MTAEMTAEKPTTRRKRRTKAEMEAEREAAARAAEAAERERKQQEIRRRIMAQPYTLEDGVQQVRQGYALNHVAQRIGVSEAELWRAARRAGVKDIRAD